MSLTLSVMLPSVSLSGLISPPSVSSFAMAVLMFLAVSVSLLWRM